VGLFQAYPSARQLRPRKKAVVQSEEEEQEGEQPAKPSKPTHKKRKHTARQHKPKNFFEEEDDVRVAPTPTPQTVSIAVQASLESGKEDMSVVSTPPTVNHSSTGDVPKHAVYWKMHIEGIGEVYKPV